MLTALTANVNRDATKTPEPYQPRDFLLFSPKRQSDAVLSPEVSAVALALRHDDRCPPLVLAAWPQILASAKDDTPPPRRRALHSDDEQVWVLAPSWEGTNIRAGLVAVRGRLSGPITLRDLDKPLLTYRVHLPSRPGFGWIEARALLLAVSE